MLNWSPRVLALLAIVQAVSVPATAQELSNADRLHALDKIVEASKEICTSVPVSGNTSSLQLDGDAKAKLSGLLNYLSDLGIEGAAKYGQVEYSGVLQSELAGQIQSTNECRLNVLNTLREVLLEDRELEGNAPAHNNAAMESFSDIVAGLSGRWNGRVDCTSRYLPWFTFTADYEESSSVFLSGVLTVTGEATSRFATQVGVALPSTLTLVSDVGEPTTIRVSGQSRGSAGRLLDMVVESRAGGVYRGVVGTDNSCSVIMSKI